MFSALLFSGVIRFLWPHHTGLWLCLCQGMLLLHWDYQNSVTLIILGKATSQHSWLDALTHRMEKMLSGQSSSLRSPTWCCQANTTLNRAITTKYFGMERNLVFPSVATSNCSGNCWAVIDLSLNDPFFFVWWRLWKVWLFLLGQNPVPACIILIWENFHAHGEPRSLLPRNSFETHFCVSVCNRLKHKRFCGPSHLGWTCFYGSPSN